MDLFDQLSEGREDKALDRLATMLIPFEAESEIEQDLALERAMAYCEREWGSYAAGLDALARRIESRSEDAVAAAVQSLRLREEAAEPGAMIGSIRHRRRRELGRLGERASVIALYGSEAAAAAPTAFETIFIAAAAHLSDPDQANDPFGPLAGWQLAWHDLPDELRLAVSTAHPLPATVTAARDECLKWEERLSHLELVFDCAGAGALPTACAARRKVVDELWRKGGKALGLDDVLARLGYWAGRGGDDGAGYGVLLQDLTAVAAGLSVRVPSESTKDKARQLKAAHPDWSLAKIGAALGISRQAVHKHLKGFTPPV